MAKKESLKPRRILSQVSKAVLTKDLEKYRQHAIEYGATDAKIIPRESILVDERVWAKCSFPPCPAYNACAQCPPRIMPFERIGGLVNRYQYAIFLMLKVVSERVTWEVKPEDKIDPKQIQGSRDYHKYKKFVDYQRYQNNEIEDTLKLDEIVGRIEVEAFFDGYHLALGLGAFTCKTWCKDSCNLLNGGACSFPYAPRPTVQAMALNVMQMAADVGWEIYPIGCTTSAGDVPHGTRLGLVLIH